MIPLRDSLRPGRVPVLTLGLVAINVAAFVWRVTRPDAVEVWGLVPARLLAGIADPREWATVLTSMFLHADIFHLLGNVWFLWIFGDNVEDRLGRGRFLLFYLLSGLAAAFGQFAADPTSPVPMIGASGAIAGVLGAYLRFFPGARVLAVVPIFFFAQLVEIRAVVFLGIWFLIQIVSSLLGGSGVAWWAHIGGFVAGFLLALPVTRGRAPVRRARRR